ncbi:S8 family serine peptidase [Croceivirga thetidis]|uniref:S8 family serine peptidase n=1 Tax=Croceivirga thetidis TaxID=2721623 RepID=A0ABX1GN60_9FLAO|nr:S8 family serine peptidase [Croceivirga thetidis]NKI31098.1 S8 family serine peptidase [Croceivirga thetidis]
MDNGKNPPKSGFLLIVFFSLFASIPTYGQTAEKSITTSFFNEQGLQRLKKKFQKENNSNQLKLHASFFKDAGTISKANGQSSSLRNIAEDGTAIFYTTYALPKELGATKNSTFYSQTLDLGLSGFGMKSGVWDAGMALETHQEFDSRIRNTDLSSEIDTHATMVTGVIASTGINERAKGVAFESELITNDWISDRIEVITEIENGMLVSNHSYGIKTENIPDWYFGAYLPISRNWDEIMYNAPYYLMVAAAGNGQNLEHNQNPTYGKTEDGFDLLVGFATSKNGLVVTGANTEYNSQGILSEAGLTNYSSFGPTDDGRVKPDIAGNGQLIFTTAANTESSYSSSMGTSMAAPGVSGSLVLLQELHQNLFDGLMKSSSLKGLVLHTADDVYEPGPDYKLGWGVLNTKRAADFLEKRDFSTLLLEESLQQSETKSYQIESNGSEALRVSLSWTDPEGDLSPSGIPNSGVATLVNDLDIRIEKDGKLFFPFKLDPSIANTPALKGDNNVDPFELIAIDDADGTYKITISHKGNLKFGNQDFSLLVSGIKLNSCSLNAPSELEFNKTTELGCAFVWEETPETLFEVQYRKADDVDWTNDFTWKSSYFISGLEHGNQYQFKVRSICSQSLESDFSETKQFVFEGEESYLSENSALSHSLPLQLYPNPTVNQISISERLDEETNFKITDLTGKIKKQGMVTGAIDVSDLSSGLYIMTTTTREGSQSAKFLKN